MTKKENKVLVRNLFLTLLLLENLDDLEFTSLFKQKIKMRLNSLKTELEKIPGAGYKALDNENALAHTEIYLNFSSKFDKFYKNFLEKYNLNDEGQP